MLHDVMFITSHGTNLRTVHSLHVMSRITTSCSQHRSTAFAGTVQTVQVKPVGAVQVLERANKSEYGLAAGVFSKDVDMINSISRCCLHTPFVCILTRYIQPPTPAQGRLLWKDKTCPVRT